MTSLAVRLNEKFRSSTVETVLAYLDEPDSSTDSQKQKKIQDLVAKTIAGCWPKTVVYLPLPGKPDPHLPLDPLLKTPRQRVLQKGQKGNTCLYYALKKIRMQVGKNSAEKFTSKRTAEKRASEWRKGKTRIHKVFKKQLLFAQEEVPGHGLVTKKNIAAVIKDIDTLCEPENRKEVRALCKQFNQSKIDTVLDFVNTKFIVETAEHNKKYLSLYDIPLESAYNDLLRATFHRDWKLLSPKTQSACISNCILKVMSENYGLKFSSWRPTQPIEKLGEEIETHGPHVITGELGKFFYKQPPSPTSRVIEGRSVYAWQLNAKRIDNEGSCHAVVLVGVDCDKKHVFFLDPTNPSDPEKPFQEKIYAISYDNLTRNSFSVCNFQKMTITLDYPYAIHGDPALARL